MSKRVKSVVPKGFKMLPPDLKWTVLNYIGLRAYQGPELIVPQKQSLIGWMRDKSTGNIFYSLWNIYISYYITELGSHSNLTPDETRLIRWSSVRTIHLETGTFINDDRRNYITNIFIIPLVRKTKKFSRLTTLTLRDSELTPNTLPMPSLRKLIINHSFIPNVFFKKNILS